MVKKKLNILDMKKVKLSTLKDGEKFFISLRSKIEYSVTKKDKYGVQFTATISQKTYLKNGSVLVIKIV